MQTEEQLMLLGDLILNIDASLECINEFLRDMLDMYRAANHKLKFSMTSTDVLRDVLEPVSPILYCVLAYNDASSPIVQLHLEDSGSGIPKEKRGNLF